MFSLLKVFLIYDLNEQSYDLLVANTLAIKKALSKLIDQIKQIYLFVAPVTICYMSFKSHKLRQTVKF